MTSTTSSTAPAATTTTTTSQPNYLLALNQNGSGLDTKAITTSLVNADIDPKKNIIQGRIDTANTSISALGKIKAQFQSMNTALQNLASTTTLSISGGGALGAVVTDPTKVADGSTSVAVTQIAKPQVLEFKGFSSPTATVGSGSISVDFGSWSGSTFTAAASGTAQTITVPQGATLTDVANSLNALSGVSAQVVNKGDGTYSLAVISDTGAQHALQLTATPNASDPGLSAFDTTTTNSTAQVQAAADATLTVNGVSVQRASNKIDDIVPGVTLNLTATTSATPLTVAHDSAAALKGMQALVDQINQTSDMLNSMTARATSTSSAGPLSNDPTAQALKQQLSSIVNGPFSASDGSQVYLSDFGVTTGLDGKLSINQTTFDKAFTQSPTKFDTIFGDTMAAADSRVTVTPSVATTATPGTFSFVQDTANGTASLDGTPLLSRTLANGDKQYVVASGDLSGTLITAPPAVTATNIVYGQGILTQLTDMIGTDLGTSGNIGQRVTQLNDTVTKANSDITKLDTEAQTLTARYTKSFAAMEQAITQFKSTGSYLTNLVNSWTKSSSGG